MSVVDGKYTISTIFWGIVAIAGCAVWLFFLQGAEAERAWRSLLINFLFFTSLAGGMVVWPAVVRSCNGRWAGRLERPAFACIAFAIPSLLALLVLWIGSARWAPWHGKTFHQGVWLDNTFIFVRDLAALAAFWGMALRYLRDRSRGRGNVSGGILILVYCLVFSLLGLDLVMALDPEWFSTLAGGYFFISGLYIAVTGWTFLSVWRPETTPEQMQDLGKLITAFSLMTTYLMYAHLLPIWYENLPPEVRFLVPRMNFQPWVGISYALVAVVYLGPTVFFLTERAKRRRWPVGALSLLILTGMWVERWWLVAPLFQREATFGLAELSLAAAFVGMLWIGIEQFERRVPPGYLQSEGE